MTTAGLDNVKLTGRPVIISDVDDVVLTFIEPFQRFLVENSFRFLPRSFRLTGNIVRIETEEAVDEIAVRGLLDRFFEEQENWQDPVAEAVAVLSDLSNDADILFLTAMTPAYIAQRRTLLDALGLHYPLVATREAKGHVAARILGDSAVKTAFIDDMAHHISSVKAYLPDCLLIHMPPESDVHAMAPGADKGTVTAKNWPEARHHIRKHFQLS